MMEPQVDTSIADQLADLLDDVEDEEDLSVVRRLRDVHTVMAEKAQGILDFIRCSTPPPSSPPHG